MSYIKQQVLDDCNDSKLLLRFYDYVPPTIKRMQPILQGRDRDKKKRIIISLVYLSYDNSVGLKWPNDKAMRESCKLVAGKK